MFLFSIVLMKTYARFDRSKLKLVTAVFADPEVVGLRLFAFTAETAEKTQPVLENKETAAAFPYGIILTGCRDLTHDIAVIRTASWTCHICSLLFLFSFYFESL